MCVVPLSYGRQLLFYLLIWMDAQTGTSSFECTVPTYTVLDAACSFDDAIRQLHKENLSTPLVVKPIWADGRDGSHALAVVTLETGLRRLLEAGTELGLSLPAVAQRYVPHSGCLFKVRFSINGGSMLPKVLL